MNTLFTISIFGSGLVLSGCQAPIIERSHGNGEYGYFDNGRHGYAGRSFRDREYGPRNGEQREIPNSNGYVTTAHRDRLNHSSAESQPRSERVAANGTSPTDARRQIASHSGVQNPKKIHSKSPDKKRCDQSTKHESGAQNQQ